MENHLAVNMVNITKSFGDNLANDSINLDIRKGEVHSLLGENGAGKSTLMNVLYGIHRHDSGDIYINGEKVIIRNPQDAIEMGLGMVHQHFKLIDVFTVTENIILGKETTKKFGFLEREKAKKTISELSEKYGLFVEPDKKIMDISVGMQQRVEILKALYRGAEILILDEPTAVLTPQEIDELMLIIKKLKQEGKTIIIITHKLREIKSVADRCTIIRRGKKIQTVDVADVSEQDLADMMVGRSVNFEVSKPQVENVRPALEIKNLVVRDVDKHARVNGLNLTLNYGEILGLAGVDGNGQIELADALSGMVRAESGEIIYGDRHLEKAKPIDFIRNGILSIPNDRQKHGLVLEYSAEYNLAFLALKSSKFSKGGIIKEKEINENALKLMEEYDIRPRDPKASSGSFSGGNQQKIVIARQISDNPNVLIAVCPTRGLDVGAIEYVHKFLVTQRNMGKAVLLISFELDEILSLSDRIAVIFDGKISAIKDANNTNESELGLLMAGGKDEKRV